MSKKIYTKTGDQGRTGLINGERLAKDSLVFEVLGTLDEFNASLGLIVAHFEDDLIEELEEIEEQVENTQDQMGQSEAQAQKNFLLDLQRQLFKLGAEVAKSPLVKFENEFLEHMEGNIDHLQAILGKKFWSNFVLPGGSELAAQVDLSRTICRRLERRLVSLDNERDLRDMLIKFINRTSDYLYMLRSWVNQKLKTKEVPV